jgi:plastocyanin
MFKAAAQAKARHIRSSSAALLSLGLIAMAGCGSSSSSSSTSTPETTPAPASTTTSTATSTATAAPESSGGSSLSLEANAEGQLKYNTTSLSAKAGKVSIDFTNSSPVGHNVTIENAAGKEVGATPTFSGGSKTLTATLKPGTYKFFCSVPGHRAGGMEGTLTVK